MTDEEFMRPLREYLDAAARRAGGEHASAYPVFKHSDGTINREQTMTTYVNMGYKPGYLPGPERD